MRRSRFRRPAALLELPAASAGTWIVVSHLRFGPRIGLLPFRSLFEFGQMAAIRGEIATGAHGARPHPLQQLIAFSHGERLLRPLRVDLAGHERDRDRQPLLVVREEPVPAGWRKPRAAHETAGPVAPQAKEPIHALQRQRIGFVFSARRAARRAICATESASLSDAG
jgi:hypothetical protein